MMAGALELLGPPLAAYAAVGVAARTSADDKPYKGPESYQYEDMDLFFGRDRETEEMVSLFLRGPISVLHAPSGAGKSSLLNARVIPSIEATGVNCVRVTPQNDPMEAIRVGVLIQLLPPLQAEAKAMSDLLEERPELADRPLEDAIAAYQEIEFNDPLRRRLITPFHVTLSLDGRRRREGRAHPMFCKLLAGTRTLRDYGWHLRAMFADHPVRDQIRRDEWKGAPLAKLRDLLASQDADAAHGRWMARLDLPEIGFNVFLRNFWREWAREHPRFPLCLIVDQFEELFTRYTDRGSFEEVPTAASEDAPRWELRESFFGEIGRLIPANGSSDVALPVHLVLSMRDEYLGQLATVREVQPHIEHARYRLDFLSRSDARRAIREPAKLYGFDYEKECYDRIIQDLVREGRFVEPAHIQIVCEDIWERMNAQLAKNGHPAPEPEGEPVMIDLPAFMKLTGGAQNVLRSYFAEILEELRNDWDRLEAIDMLSYLLTQSGTRNLCEVRSLVATPLRDHEQRASILSHLQRRNIVRVEPRVGSNFAEITHEFLLGPLQKAISERSYQHPDELPFRFALQAFAAARRSGNTDEDAAMRVPAVALAQLLKSIDRVTWTQADAAVALRAAVIHGADHAGFRRLFALVDGRGGSGLRSAGECSAGSAASSARPGEPVPAAETEGVPA